MASRGGLAFNGTPPVKMTQSLNTRKVTEQVLRVISRHGKRGVNKPMLAASIVAEARRQSYDPLFVAAVIKSESGFDSIAQSGVGARGLMQLMPGTARYVEDMKPEDASKRGDLTDPGHNLKLGIRYLKHLEAMYGGNRVLTLMAYNWGPGHVERTVKGGQGRGVPKPVVNYALKILSDHSRWVKEISGEARNPKSKV
jgi:soluble lytic murein transglycosylase-like protein